jgi:hypothetical protein
LARRVCDDSGGGLALEIGRTVARRGELASRGYTRWSRCAPICLQFREANSNRELTPLSRETP